MTATRTTWGSIMADIVAMEELTDGPLPSTIRRAVALCRSLSNGACPISVTTRRSLGSDRDDGITLTWRGPDNTYRDITVWDERDT